MSNEAMSDIRALKRELLTKLAEVDEQEARLKESYDQRRHDALHTLTAVAMSRIRELGLSVVSVNEGASLSSDLLDAGLSPRPGRGEVAVQFSSARERKGYIDHADRVDYRNVSYREDEMVIVSFIFPRKDLEGPLGTLETLSKEMKG